MVNAQPEVLGFKNKLLDFETRSLDLVEQMTLEEKISLLKNVSKYIPCLGAWLFEIGGRFILN